MLNKTPFLLLTCLLFLACQVGAAEIAQPVLADNLSNLSALFNQASSTAGQVRERMAARRLLADLIETSRAYLHEKLANGTSIERQVSAAILGKAGDLRDETILIQSLQVDDPILYVHAATALKDIFSRAELPAQLARLDYHHDNSQERLSPQAQTYIRSAALCAIAVKCEADNLTLATTSAKKILPYLEDLNPLVRRMACNALGFAASPEEATPPLVVVLHSDFEVTTKRRAAYALGKFQGAGRAALLMELDNPDPFLRIEVAAALVRSGEIEYLKILHQASMTGLDPDEKETGKLNAAAGLLQGDRGNDSKVSVPVGGTPVSPLRMAALEMLAELGSPFSEDHLAALLTDPSWQIRAAAAQALGNLQGIGITQALHNLLSDPDPRVRSKAAIALAAQGVVGIQWTVARDLKHQNPFFQVEAAKTLGLLSAEQTIDNLAELASSPNLGVACSAAKALGVMPQGNPAAVKELLLILADPRFAVQVEAALSLKKLTGLPFTSKPAEAQRKWQEKKR